MTNQDERLKGNEKIETAIAALQRFFRNYPFLSSYID